MFKLPASARSWTQLFNQAPHRVAVRTIATPSAIHRGLRRSRVAPEPSYGGRGRSAKPVSDVRGSARPSRPSSKPFADDRIQHARSPRERMRPALRSAAGSVRAGTWDRRSDDSGRYTEPGAQRQLDRSKSHRPSVGRDRSINARPEQFDRRDDRPLNRRERRALEFGQTKEDSLKQEKPDTPGGPRGKASREFGSDKQDYRRTDRLDRPKSDQLNRYEHRARDFRQRDQEKVFDDELAEFGGSRDRAMKFSGSGRTDTRTDSSPERISFTTPASEFLYGASVVYAALKSSHRKFYKLYFCNDQNRSPASQSILVLAKKLGVEIKRTNSTAPMDRIAAGRPHNGVVLEASPLKRPPIASLLEITGPGQKIVGFVSGMQSKEDLEINGTETVFQAQRREQRYPLVLFLDGVQDTGNMGGIIRSAQFLGVDAVVMSSTCAPLNAVVLKASAGAAETVPLFSVSDTSGFVQNSQQSGWKFFASVAPQTKGASGPQRPQSRSFYTDDMKAPLHKGPCVLMIGGEGDGLKRDLIKKADANISIKSHRAGHSTVDSLNVSVATGILIDAFLRVAPRPAERATNELIPNSGDETQENSDAGVTLW